MEKDENQIKSLVSLGWNLNRMPLARLNSCDDETTLEFNS